MRKIAAVVLLLLPLQIYAQQHKVEGFTKKVFSSDFSEADKSVWPLKNSQYYFFFIQDGKYILECKRDDEKKAYLIPKGSPALESFLLEANITIGRGGLGSVGLAFDVQSGLTNGYLFEINANRQFRVSHLLGSGEYEYLTGDTKRDGWEDFPDINRVGVTNLLTVVKNKTKQEVDIVINGKHAFNFKDKIESGQSGLCIGGPSKAEVQNFAIYTHSPNTGFGTHPQQTASTSTKSSDPDAIVDEVEMVPSADIATLTAGLLDCRKQNKELIIENETNKLQINQYLQKQEELQAFIKNNLDVKLQTQLKEQETNLQAIKAKNDALVKENNELKAFKQTVERNKDGDLVIVLSENLKKEQEKNTALQEQVKKLQEEVKILKSK